MFGHITKVLTAYHHGELSPEERRRVEAHIARCRSCREKSENIRHVVGLVSRGLRSHGALEAHPAEAIARGSAPRVRGLRWALVPLAAAVVTIGIYAWYQT